MLALFIFQKIGKLDPDFFGTHTPISYTAHLCARVKINGKNICSKTWMN